MTKIWEQQISGPTPDLTENGRREFLCSGSCAILAALLGTGLSSAEALALPVLETMPEAAEGNDRTYPLPAADSVSIDQTDDVILVRSANRVYAFALACPHENTALRWREQDHRFQCPRHQSKYQPDGIWISGRATRNMDRFALRLEGQKVIVDLSKLYRSDKQKPEWDAAVIAL